MSFIGKLVNNTIDIAAADFTITAARSEAVDFLPVLIESFIRSHGRDFWITPAIRLDVTQKQVPLEIFAD